MAQAGTRPLSLEEQHELISKLDQIPDDHSVGRLLIEAFLYTGIHPAVLSNARRHQVKIQEDGQLALTRPKNSKVVYIPLGPEIRESLPVLLEELRTHPRSPVRINQLVHAAGKTIGMGWITPRGLRHTFGYMAWLKFKDPNLVAAWMGGSVSTVFEHYVNASDTPQKREIVDHGWSV